ncbi:hypothetical protein PInf_002297 [Phytophthora infestans]|nr:hypothetical protein PInf_021182 [Phytophthora infestans]KAI9997963.1 hypothetical protein PInf_002297 [Phytophthora infestans]
MRITYEYFDAPKAGHPSREKLYALLTRDLYWDHQYKWVRKYFTINTSQLASMDRERRSGVSQLIERDDAVAQVPQLRFKYDLDARSGLSSLSDLRHM